MTTIASQNIYFIEQGRDLVRRLDDDRFCCSLNGQSGIGAHLRHVIDCFRCFQRGLDAGRIDYDSRQRDSMVEKDRNVADGAMAEIIDGLQRLTRHDAERQVKVKVDTAAWEDPSLHWNPSSVGRELQFLLSHTVHHYALIALLLRQQGFEPGADFGVAPSTLEFQGKAIATSGAVAG